jgi:predicted phosphodiesterase
MPSIIDDAKRAGIERLVCLGDYDEPKVLKQVFDLKMKKIVLIGNHDYHLCRGLNLTSSDLHNDIDYYDLWEDTPEAKFVLDASEKQIRKKGLRAGIKIYESINGKRVVYVHGGLYSSFPELNNDLDPYLWARFFHHPHESNLLPNLLKMQKENIDIMFRGHDHKQALIIGNTRDLSSPVMKEGDCLYNGINFERGKRYIVSLGKFSQGSYAVYDSSNQSVKFGTMK